MRLHELLKKDVPCNVMFISSDAIYYWDGMYLYNDVGRSQHAKVSASSLFDDRWEKYQTLDEYLKERGYLYNFRTPYYHTLHSGEKQATITVKPTVKMAKRIIDALENT